MATLGLSGLKPLATALALPPVPLLLLVLIAGRMLASGRRGGAGAVLLLFSVAGLWLSCCAGVGNALERWVLRPPAALSEARIASLRHESASRKVVVLILGGGRESLAPEYREAHLSARSMQRLHYGLWLARQLNAPAMFTGGTGLSQLPGPAEADIAARIAERDYGRRLRWVETTSRDTRENAAASLNLLTTQGITDVIVVTHDWHMPRALRAFEEAARRNKHVMQIIPAPMGLASGVDRPALNWMPTQEGFAQVRLTLREALGLLFGA
ncbi:YdcF family protein [Aquabacterium sp.]|uniref:YdcF family protein n=1 Tax=Aquabacterium sp. TaxID=1872578 RepID=UPI002B6BEBE2|nr:YdcF family protein [Aquabacterium sp.]HSW07915.1 YdcF family protein [Aquabacterium sp.]